MFHKSNPRWTRLFLVMLWAVAALTSSSAFAGTTHSEGGAASEAPGVPETDGTATVQIYWTGDSAARTSTTMGATLAGYWLHDAGFALSRQWLVGDEHVALLEMQTGAGTAAHAGYYGISTKNLTSLDPDEFAAMTVRPMPVPLATAGPGYVDLAWAHGLTSGASAVTGYNVFRSTDGIAFTKMNAVALTDTTYRDLTAVFGTDYRYAVSLVYRGTPNLESSITSGNSAIVSPLDSTPPDAPELIAEPGFTPGTDNALAWSDESASGATAYYVECALDAAFTSLVGNSGWIATMNYSFTGLADGRTYFYRVRARDAATNVSDNSAAVSSRQDASAPSSHLLALGAFKASSTVSLDWTAIDSLSGVASVQLFYAKDGGSYTLYPGGPFTSSPIAFDAATTGGDGAYTFYTNASDAVANAEDAPEVADASTIVDTQAPSTPELVALPAFTAGTDRTVEWSSAAASGADSYRIQASLTADFATIAATSDWTTDFTFTFSGLTDGSLYNYRVESRDAATNESAWSTLASSTQDASGPVTAVETLAVISNQSAQSIAWSGTDAASGLNGVQLFWSKDGGAFAMLGGGPFMTSPIAFDAAAFGGDGTYAFYTVGTDAVGNIEAAPASADASIIIDTAAPAAPQIAAIPGFTAGIARSITWTGAESASFFAQAATDAGFANLVTESGWTTDANFAFEGLADATMYFYRVKGRDTAGNESAYSDPQSSTQDASAPTTAAGALPATSNAATFDIAWSGSDATSGLASVDLYVSKDGGTFTPYPGGPFATSPIAFDAMQTGGDGAYRFYTRGHDAVDNHEDAPTDADTQTMIDTAAPGAPSIAGMQTFTKGEALLLTWSDESATGAIEYRAEMSKQADFALIETNSDWMSGLSFDFEPLNDGQEYFFRVQARDAAHNATGYSGVQSTTMDAMAPQATIAALPATTNDPHMQLEWSGTDATSGIANVDLYISKDGAPFGLVAGGPFETSPIAFDASASGDGMYAFYLQAHDRAGNIEAAPAAADASTQLDTAAPGAPQIAALPEFTPGSTRLVSWDDVSAAGATAYHVQASIAADFSSIDFESGWIAATSYEFSSLADGQIYHYRVQSRDALTNASAFGTPKHSTQDATAPASQITALPATSAAMLIALGWSGTDATSGMQGIDLYYSKDGGPFELLAGGPFASSPIDFDAATTGGDGDYAFYSIAHDAVGNIEMAPASGDAHTMIDTAAPTAPTLASINAFSAGNAVALSWNALGAGDSYRAQMSNTAAFGSILQDTGWITATNFVFGGLVDGQQYFFRVQARDGAQNQSAFSAMANTTMDAGLPSSTLAALPALMNSSGLALEWNGFDTVSGIMNVDLYYSRNGSAFAMYAAGPFTASPIAFDASTTGGDGNYAFYVRARDNAGNVEGAPGAPDATTRIDTTAPNMPAITALQPFSPGSTVQLAWSNQSASGATEYQADASMDAGFATIAATTGWISGTSFAFNGLDDGTTYYFRARSRDAALNESSFSSNQSTTLDDTAPASLVGALPSITPTLTFPLAWTGNDATSGVASIDLYYAKDGGAYTLLPGGPWTSSPIAFDASTLGGQGTYAFYSRARDRVGNREPAPAGPDAQTTINTAATGSPTLASLPGFTPGTSRTLTWTPGANNNTYLAQAATDASFGGIAAQSDWATATSYNFGGLSDGQTYWYRVKSRSAANVEGSWSAAQSSTQDATPPASQLASLPSVSTSPTLDLAWSGADATSGLAGVRLFVSKNGAAYAEYAGGPFMTSPIAFDAATLGGDGQYAFYSRALDVTGNFEAAPSSADANTMIDTTAPNAPAMLAEPTSTQGSSNTIAWNATAGADEYYAQCSSDAAFANILTSSGWISTTNFTFTSLEIGTTYWYRVRARDAVGNIGLYSQAVSSTQSAGYILPTGWNLISFNVNPPDHAIDKVLISIAGSYNIVRTYDQNAFLTYLPSLPIGMNDLQNVDALHGYWVYMTKPDTLLVSGTPVSAGTPIDLASGWNLAGYLPTTPMTPSAGLASIAGSYALARGYESGAGYHTYYPTLPTLSDLLELRSGNGYWLYMTTPDQLVYGGLPKANDTETTMRGLNPSVASDGLAVPTVMDLYSSEFTIDGQPAPAGTVVEALDATEHVVAQATVRVDGLLPMLHLSGDVTITETDEGLVPGEAFVLKVRDRDLTLLGDTSFTWHANAAQATKLEFVATESLLPKVFALGQNVPNPFNPTTIIAYAIPSRVDGQPIASSQVDLRVFDIRGRVVKTLVTARQAPGRYSVTWNGRDDHGSGVGAGVYFVRFKTESFTQSRKMLLVK